MKVFWTKRSKRRFLEISKYIAEEFGENSADKFKAKTLDFIELLSKFPELGSLEVAEKNIYGFQLTKQTRLFYRINENQIALLTFFSSRQNPKKKPI